MREPLVTKKVQDAAFELISQMVEYFQRIDAPLSEIIFVPLIIFFRIARTRDAIEALVRAGFHTEAAVLVLTQFELRLDIAYTARDIEQATEWLSHENTKWSVKSIKDKIKFLLPDEAERSKLNEIATCLHGIKHGNPIYSELGFPVRQDGHQMVVSTGEITDGFSEKFGGLVSDYSSYQLAWSSQVLNIHIAQYAKVDRILRERVCDLARTLHPVEEELRTFLRGVVTRGKGAFAMKPFKHSKN